ITSIKYNQTTRVLIKTSRRSPNHPKHDRAQNRPSHSEPITRRPYFYCYSYSHYYSTATAAVAAAAGLVHLSIASLRFVTSDGIVLSLVQDLRFIRFCSFRVLPLLCSVGRTRSASPAATWRT
ncbi:unnamed protein product, partial [Laminaria digitata]